MNRPAGKARKARKNNRGNSERGGAGEKVGCGKSKTVGKGRTRETIEAQIQGQIKGTCRMRFEDLDVWVEGCTIAVEIYEITNRGKFTKDYALRDQMRKCSVSIPSNIAEGKERETVNELIRFLYIAKGSAGELKTQLFISNRVGYVDDETYANFSQRILKVSKMLGNFIKMLKREKSEKGVKREKSE